MRSSCPEIAGVDCLRLVDGPSLFLTLYCRPQVEAKSELCARREQHRNWLETFNLLKTLALDGKDTRNQQGHLKAEIEEHLQWEETHLFPALDAFLSTNRVTRELSYEHLGIRRLLPKLGPVLEQLPHHANPRKLWEQFALELIHLIEHHIEREERSIYPLWERLSEGNVLI